MTTLLTPPRRPSPVERATVSVYRRRLSSQRRGVDVFARCVLPESDPKRPLTPDSAVSAGGEGGALDKVLRVCPCGVSTWGLIKVSSEVLSWGKKVWRNESRGCGETAVKTSRPSPTPRVCRGRGTLGTLPGTVRSHHPSRSVRVAPRIPIRPARLNPECSAPHAPWPAGRPSASEGVSPALGPAAP